ncbi:MAG TPA: GntR family transcriptional regulator [bacterium]|nr:GntR family transcriptional regulator [bacterium]
METKKDKSREKINEFILNNNSHLTEEILCKKFKVSRTPVREVLKYLEQDGFIQK